jgi:preprotein translocase subunit SecB
MESKNQSNLSFHGVDIVESKLQVKQRYNFEQSVQMETTADLIRPSQVGHFEILMTIKLKVENYFELIVHGIGHFTIDPAITGKSYEDLIHGNATAIMFPYLRAFVSILSANCGQVLPALVIPPQFFQGTLKTIDRTHTPLEGIL